MSSLKPLVSVVVPYYEQPKYLPESVQSALNQRFEDLEVIVVDDCSPNHPAAVVLGEIDDPRLTILRNDTNKGCPASRNNGISQSRGDILLPLDGDDLLDAEYLSATLPLITEGGFDAVYTHVQLFGEQSHLWTWECSLISALCGAPGPATFLYKREVYEACGGYKTTVHSSDLEFWISVLKRNCRIGHIERPLFLYRKHAQGKSNYNREINVAEMIDLHRDLYVENLKDVIRAGEEKYWRLHKEYEILEEGFRNAMYHYRLLESGLAASTGERFLKRVFRRLSRLDR